MSEDNEENLQSEEVIERDASGRFIRRDAINELGCDVGEAMDPQSARTKSTEGSATSGTTESSPPEPNYTPVNIPPGEAPPDLRDVDFAEREQDDFDNAEAVKDYLGGNYVKDLYAFSDTADVRSLQSTSSQWTESRAKQVRTFLEEFQNSPEMAATFQAKIYNIAKTYVKPLVDPIIMSPWGRKRNSNVTADRAGGETVMRNPETGEIMYRHHLGVDYDTRNHIHVLGKNQPCYSVDSGEVITSGWISGYGKAIYIHHGNGITTRYGHLSEILVSNGESVSTGQMIGKCGDTDFVGDEHRNINHPHLHFELRINRGIIRDGEVEVGLANNTANISIDPTPLLTLAPNPNESREQESSEIIALRKAMNEYYAKATEDDSDMPAMMRASVKNMADSVASFMRAEEYTESSRADYYSQQQRNTSSQTSSMMSHANMSINTDG